MLAGIAALLAACGGSARGPVADGGRDTVAVVDRVDPRLAMCSRYQAQIDAAPSPPFDVVQQIFDDNCTGCHGTGAVLESCGGTLVVPGDPVSSYLYQKLTLSHPCAGAQMPLDELFTSQPLPECMTSIVRDWIQAGAQPQPGEPTDGAAPGG